MINKVEPDRLDVEFQIPRPGQTPYRITWSCLANDPVSLGFNKKFYFAEKNGIPQEVKNTLLNFHTITDTDGRVWTRTNEDEQIIWIQRNIEPFQGELDFEF